MSQPIQVLIVEDNPADAELLVLELRRAKFDPQWHRVETEADYLASLHPDLDLILSDFEMPEFNGLRALELLNEREYTVPFILVSGTIGEDMAVTAMKGGAADYFLKDRLARLGSAVIQSLEQSKLRDQYKEAEKERIESEGKFRLLAENITDVFWITSPNLDKISYVSPAYESIWGFSAKSLYANPHQWSEAIVPEDRERVHKAFGALMGDEATVSVEYRIARPDGTVRWVHDRGFQVRDAAGNVLHLTGLAADITERKKAEEENENQLRELRRWRELTLGREERIQSLKGEVNEALEQSGKPARYARPKAGEKEL